MYANVIALAVLHSQRCINSIILTQITPFCCAPDGTMREILLPPNVTFRVDTQDAGPGGLPVLKCTQVDSSDSVVAVASPPIKTEATDAAVPPKVKRT